MNEVTDPNLLKQLEGNAKYSSAITDPDLIAKLEKSAQPVSTKSNKVSPEDMDSLNKESRSIPYANVPYVPFTGGTINTAQQRQAENLLSQGAKGAAQNFLNTPEEAANVFGKHMYNKFNFAPPTKAAKTGGVIGDIASFFQPEFAANSILKAASLAPKAGAAIASAKDWLKASPYINTLLNFSKNAGQGALFEKEKNPKATSSDIAKAGAFSGTIPAMVSMLGTTNPLLSLIAKMGIGGTLGYNYSGTWPGAAEGAASFVAAPKILKEMGLGFNQPVSSEYLTENPNALAQSRYEAGNRIGAPVRPSEAFDNPNMAANEGRVSTTDIGSNAMADFAKTRVEQQKNAINKLLNTIYPKTKKAGNAIRDLYADAFKNDLPQEQVNSLLEDPLIKQAYDNVKTDPVYMKKLKDIPENNFAYLDQMKRNLGAQSKKAARIGDDVAAREYKNSEKTLVDQMDKQFPDYAKARSAAQSKIIRKQLEKTLGNKEINGRTFFDAVLRNDNKYQKLVSDLQSSPEALDQVKDMKLAWENLIGKDTVRTAAGMASKNTSAARNDANKFWNLFKDTVGAPRDIERAKFIHDPKWWDKFDEVSKYKDAVKRRQAMSDLFARGIGAIGLESAQNK